MISSSLKPKGIWSTVLFAVIGISNLSMIQIDPYELLSDDDLALEQYESEGHSHINSALDENPYWESFNTWSCFSTETVQLYCAEIDYDRSTLPTLSVTDTDGKLTEFDLDPDSGLSCEDTLNAWQALLLNQRSFCTYAVFLQNLSDDSQVYYREHTDHELWIVDKIKTNLGYWSLRVPEEDNDPLNQLEK